MESSETRATIDDLAAAIAQLHGCSSRWVESVLVQEKFNGETAWDCEVHVFDLADHPTALRAYAWPSGISEGERRFEVVLHLPPVDSPRTAVRASRRR
jgi:hypothetical protein